MPGTKARRTSTIVSVTSRIIHTGTLYISIEHQCTRAVFKTQHDQHLSCPPSQISTALFARHSSERDHSTRRNSFRRRGPHDLTRLDHVSHPARSFATEPSMLSSAHSSWTYQSSHSKHGNRSSSKVLDEALRVVRSSALGISYLYVHVFRVRDTLPLYFSIVSDSPQSEVI